MTAITFRTLRDEDGPLLAEWLARPHVARWWGEAGTAEQIQASYCRPSTGAVSAYLAYHGDEEVGFCQTYRAAAVGDGWWPDETDPGVVGIDVFVADQARVDRGLGTEMVRALVALLFTGEDVRRVQADPDPANERAIRCFEKAGFVRRGIVQTPDGDALLLTCERTDWAERATGRPAGNLEPRTKETT